MSATQDLQINLLPWQQEVWTDKSRFKVVAAGRRTGKTRLAASLLLVKALSSKNGKVFTLLLLRGKLETLYGICCLSWGRVLLHTVTSTT